MLDAVAKDDKPLQQKIDRAKELLRNIPDREETPTFTSSGNAEYTYQTEYNGIESFTSGKNYKELQQCIAEDLKVSASKI